MSQPSSKWEVVDSIGEPSFTQFECVDTEFCCGVATGGSVAGFISVVCTDDGGESWRELWADSLRPENQPPFLRIWDLSLTPAHTALAAVDSGFVLRAASDFSAAKWTIVDPEAGRRPSFVSINSQNCGYLATHRLKDSIIAPTLHFTTNGGETWSTREMPVPEKWRGQLVSNFEALEENGGFIAYYNRKRDDARWSRDLVVSQDTGKSISVLTIDNKSVPDSLRFVLSSIDVVSSELVFLAGTLIRPPYQVGVLLALDLTTMTVEQRYSGRIADHPLTTLSNIHFRDSSHGVAGGFSNIYRTQNGGRTWTVDSVEHRPGEFEYNAFSYSDSTGVAANLTPGYMLRIGGAGTTDVPHFESDFTRQLDWNVVVNSGESPLILPVSVVDALTRNVMIWTITGELIYVGKAYPMTGSVNVPLRLEPGSYLASIVAGEGEIYNGRILVLP